MDAGMKRNHVSERRRMIEEQIMARGIQDRAVLDAIQHVPRHLFVPPARLVETYYDRPIPIGFGQTMSQPYIVASMLELLSLRPGEKVLEVGTGSGYNAAVLSEIVGWVYTIERHEELCRAAEARLRENGYHQVRVRCGDGSLGWEEESPFDAIVVTAACPSVPPLLFRQLAVGGRMVLPVGRFEEQDLVVVRKTQAGTMTKEKIYAVRFVPLMGEDGW